MLAEKQNFGAQTYPSPSTRQVQMDRVGVQTRPATHYSLFNRISMLSCIVLCAAVAWFVATVGARMNSANYEIYRLQTQIQKVAATDADLSAQVDTLSQPARILEIAKRLNLSYQNPVQIGSGTAVAGH